MKFNDSIHKMEVQKDGMAEEAIVNVVVVQTGKQYDKEHMRILSPVNRKGPKQAGNGSQVQHMNITQIQSM